MARPLKPFIRGGGYYPSNRFTPLVYPGGYTTIPDEGENDNRTSNKVGKGQADYMKLKS